MPLFLFGQTGFELAPRFQPDRPQQAVERARETLDLLDDPIEFGLSAGEDKAIEKVLQSLRSFGLVGGEIAGRMLDPSPLGAGEEDAIAAQQEREAQNKRARKLMPGALQIPVEHADP